MKCLAFGAPPPSFSHAEYNVSGAVLVYKQGGLRGGGVVEIVFRFVFIVLVLNGITAAPSQHWTCGRRYRKVSLPWSFITALLLIEGDRDTETLLLLRPLFFLRPFFHGPSSSPPLSSQTEILGGRFGS